MRRTKPSTTLLRARWARQLRLIILCLGAGALGTICVAVEKRSRPLPNIDSPPTLGPVVEDRQRVPIPVDSLRTIHNLDLTQPAHKQPVRTEVTEPPSAEVSAPKIGLLLVAPRVDDEQAPKADRTGDRSADKPPSLPSHFEPEWRSSGKGRAVSKAFNLPVAKKPGETDDVNPNAADVAARANPDYSSTTRKSDDASDEQSPVQSGDSKFADEDTATNPAPFTLGESAKPLKPLTRNQLLLRNKLRKVLSYYYRKPLNSREHDAWEVMHGMLAYGLHSQIRAGGPRGEPMTAIGWLCYNNPCKNKQLMRLNEEGEIRAQYGVGLQGHVGQFLAMLAQCNVDPSYPIRVDDQEFTIRDLIRSEQQTCYPDTELTFKLIGLMHYLPSDTQWINDRGETWSIERLIEEELKQPVRGAACGGTHRLAGLSLAVRTREARGEQLDGAFAKAAQFAKRYEHYAYRLQNSDGSFSTSWFNGSGRQRDIDRRCQTTGHILEWILYQVEDDQLQSPQVLKAVYYLTDLLYRNSSNEWEVGHLSHALHALALYDERVFQPHDRPAPVAKSSAGSPATSGKSTSSSLRQPRGVHSR